MTRIIALLLLVAAAFPAYSAQDTSTRRERNYIVEGNKHFKAKRFADAEVSYRKALEQNNQSEAALFNLASALLQQQSQSGENVKEATAILQALAKDAKDMSIAERAFYNLGNIAFNQQNYQGAIDNYKNSLRRNPENNQARDNLRLAQLKKQQNQDQNQNQNQDKNKDNKDQNQNQDQKNNQNQQPQQPKGSISPENADKILKAMENEEQATRNRVNAKKKKEGEARQRMITKPW